MRFYTPTFRSYASDELKGCGKASFPAFSITGGACALNCDHCQAKILEPMIAATNPAELERKVRDLVMLKDLGGFLLSGGSNRRNEVPYDRYYPTIEKLKREFPQLRIAVHSALLDETRARRMESAGVDVAMMDVIGAQETIRDVYHLDRPVDGFRGDARGAVGNHNGRGAAHRHRPALRPAARRGERARHHLAPRNRGADPGDRVADLCARRQALRHHRHRGRGQGVRRRPPAHHRTRRCSSAASARPAPTR